MANSLSAVDWNATAAWIALIMSSLTWLNEWRKNTRKLRVSIVEHTRTLNSHTFYLIIENLSRLPITISGIYLDIDEKKYGCKKIPQPVLGVTLNLQNDIIADAVYSVRFPIVLEGLGGTGGYFVFGDYPHTFQTLPTRLTFLIHSNRGRPVKTILELDNLVRPVGASLLRNTSL